MQPILIIGTQRSGSNLFRLMLNQLGQIAAPHPPHILQLFFPLLDKYGDLNKAENYAALAADLCAFVKANPVPWHMDRLEPTTIINKNGPYNLIQLYSAIYEAYARQNGASMWCCKSMANLYYIDRIEEQGLKPLYIHLIRDGRDVAVSFKKAIVGEKHIYHLAKQWKEDQETSERLCMQYAPDRYIQLYYEDLIHDTEATLRKLLTKIGLDFDEKILHYYEADEAKQTAEAGKMWNNVVNPVMEKNSNKYLKSLSPEEILIFESIAGDTLSHYGYELQYKQEERITVFDPAQIELFHTINKKMKEEAMASFDPEGSQKRKKQEQIIRAIKDRPALI